MQNLASISQMILPHQTSPKTNQTSTENSDLLQNFFGQNQMDSNLMNQLKNQNQSEISSVFGTNISDLSNLLANFGQSTQNISENSSTISSNSDSDIASFLAMLSAQQSSSSPTTNNANFLEQLQFLNAAQSLNAFGQNQMPGTPGFSPYSYGSPSKDTYCELCEKNFCNRYFLKTHKQKKHGNFNDVGETPGKIQNVTENSPVINGANDLDETKSTLESENRLPSSFETMLANAVQESVSTQNGNNPDFLSLIKQIAAGNCTPIKSEPNSPDRLVSSSTTSNIPVSSSSNLQTNLLNMLPNGFGMPFMLSSTPFVKMDMETPNFNTLSPITSLQNSISKPVQKRQYSSTSKNFCDLCKKEVCNKYFLRTHMLKMHNIVIDENKTVIANIDTQEKEKEGSVTFRCDVCLLDMKSRNELREHKKDIHGIQPLITPTSANTQFSRASSTGSKPSSAANSAIGTGSTQGSITAFEFPSMSLSDSPPSTATGNDFKCLKCDSEYANIEILMEHFRDDHPDLSQDEIIKYFTKSSNSTPSMIKCLYCSEQFESEIANQIHQLKNHSDIKMDDETDEAMQITQAVALKMAAENELQKLKIETFGFENKLSKNFSCKKCSRFYHSKDKLDEHYATAHQYILKLSPKKNRIVLSPTKVNKMIKSFSCLKCNSRFLSSELCKSHIIQHLKSERREQEEIGETSTNIDKENNEEFNELIISSYMRECNQKSDLNDGVERRGSHGGNAKISEEKHSHTSGSTSPMSVTVPEGYAIPLNPNNQKPFTLQTFIMREISEDGINPRFLNDLQALLPVFSPINGPIRVTFELCPAPSKLEVE